MKTLLSKGVFLFIYIINCRCYDIDYIQYKKGVNDVSRYQVIKVEDTRESLINAIKEMHDAMMKGSGIGFDFRGIESKERQVIVMDKIETSHMRKLLKPKRVNKIFRDKKY
jgi:hypothetical protein